MTAHTNLFNSVIWRAMSKASFLLSLSPQDLQLYLSNLANQIDRESSVSEIPLVVILDDIHAPGSLSELVNGALTCKYHKWCAPLTQTESSHTSIYVITYCNILPVF